MLKKHTSFPILSRGAEAIPLLFETLCFRSCLFKAFVTSQSHGIKGVSAVVFSVRESNFFDLFNFQNSLYAH